MNLREEWLGWDVEFERRRRRLHGDIGRQRDGRLRWDGRLHWFSREGVALNVNKIMKNSTEITYREISVELFNIAHPVDDEGFSKPESFGEDVADGRCNLDSFAHFCL